MRSVREVRSVVRQRNRIFLAMQDRMHRETDRGFLWLLIGQWLFAIVHALAFFTTKAVGKGTGQGLSLARAVIVDRHRGDISFEATSGVGTTFFIRLPIQVTEFAERAAA